MVMKMTKLETGLVVALIILVLIFGAAFVSLSMRISELSASLTNISGKIDTLSSEVKGIPEAIKGITHPTKPTKLAEFVIAGGWPMPPGYHGNPFGPGGVGSCYRFIHEPLYYYIPGNASFLPALAVSVEDKGKVLVVHLRKNVTWHDGKPFTSKDVKTTWALVGALWSNKAWRYIDKIETPDDYTVNFYLTRTVSPLLKITILTQPIVAADHLFGKWTDKALNVVSLMKQIWDLQAAGKEVPKDLMDKYNNLKTPLLKEVQAFKPGKPTGTGAFMLDKVTTSVLVLKKFDNHWATNKIMVGTVRILRWTSNEVVWAYHMARKIDASHAAATPDVVKQLLNDPNLHFMLTSDLSQFAIAFNTRVAPFNDINFRKAIAYAIDRKKMREVGNYYAMDEVYAHGVLPSMQSQWLPNDVLAKLTKYEYNPSKAEAILKAAGYKKGSDGYWRTPDGKTINIEVTCPAGYSDWVLALDELVRQLNSFGIKAESRPIPNPVFWSRAHAGKLGMHLNWFCSWAGTGDPYTGYYDLYYGDRSKDTGVPANKTFDTPWGKAVPSQLVDQLLIEKDPAKRKEIVWKLAYITNEYLWEIPWAEKRIQIYYLDGVRVTGWPLPTDPVWTLCPGGIERAYYVMIISGMLKPAASS